MLANATAMFRLSFSCKVEMLLEESRFRRLLDLDLGGDGHSGTECEVPIVVLIEVGEVDTDWDALDDLDVVAGSVLGWEQREARAGGSADLNDFAVELSAA